MKAAIFFRNKFPSAVNHFDFSCTGEGSSPEEAIKKVQDKLNKELLKWIPTDQEGFKVYLTYRPADGMIFCNYSNTPIGLVYQEGCTAKF